MQFLGPIPKPTKLNGCRLSSCLIINKNNFLYLCKSISIKNILTLTDKIHSDHEDPKVLDRNAMQNDLHEPLIQ